MKNKKQRLEAGETFITSEKGNSMLPLIKSGQHFELVPYTVEACEVGDIVHCKVKRHYYTHCVTAIDEKLGVQISNNHGFTNGWTKKVYGKVSRVLTMEEKKDERTKGNKAP